MKVARVVGQVWATRKHPTLQGCKLLLVKPFSSEGTLTSQTALAVDRNIGAGPGDTVLLVDEGSAARHLLKDPLVPIHLAISGIVDSLTTHGEETKFH